MTLPMPTPMPRAAVVAPPAFGARAGFSYGALGLPLAFVALPLYVVLPSHYAERHGVSLTTLGTVLLATRALAAPPVKDSAAARAGRSGTSGPTAPGADARTR